MANLRVPGSRVSSCHVQGLRVSSLRVSGLVSKGPGLRVPVLVPRISRSQVLDPDFRLCL